jgi:hypothetical protein
MGLNLYWSTSHAPDFILFKTSYLRSATILILDFFLFDYLLISSKWKWPLLFTCLLNLCCDAIPYDHSSLISNKSLVDTPLYPLFGVEFTWKWFSHINDYQLWRWCDLGRLFILNLLDFVDHGFVNMELRYSFVALTEWHGGSFLRGWNKVPMEDEMITLKQSKIKSF